MFDTHCHLNFKRFKDNVKDVIDRANKAGVTGIIVPGTDLYTSKVSTELADQYKEVYSAVGIHPHHAKSDNVSRVICDIEHLLKHKKVVAVGEVGLDKHTYQNTKYETYQIDDKFVEAQKQLLTEQIKLALEYDKALILHNREAKEDLLPLITQHWDTKLKGRTVFHCCEPDEELLDFAQKHGIFIGVDGDVTYQAEKAEFIKKVPLEMLVVETDSPYLLPEPLRSQKLYPRFAREACFARRARRANEPKNIPIIMQKIADLKGEEIHKIEKIIEENTYRLFQLT